MKKPSFIENQSEILEQTVLSGKTHDCWNENPSLRNHIVWRLKNEFFGKSRSQKMKFLSYCAQWGVNRTMRLLKRLIRNFVQLGYSASGVVSHNKRLKISIIISGGIGDLLTSTAFVKSIYEAFSYPIIDIYYHNKPVLDFVYANSGFVRNLYNSSTAARTGYDLHIVATQFSQYQPQKLNILKRHKDIFNVVSAALATEKHFSFFIRHHPNLDGMFSRYIAKDKGLTRRNVLHYFAHLPVPAEPHQYLSPDISELDWFDGLFGQRDYITIHDGWDNSFIISSDRATKCWPTDYWEAFISLFKSNHPEIEVVQLGGANSRPLKGVDICLVGRTNLHQAAWVIKNSLLHVDTESGMVHLAKVVHSNSVVLFGPTDVDFFGYPGNINLVSPNCSNCWWSIPNWMSYCPRGLDHPECMYDLTPELVGLAVDSQIRRRAASSFVVSSKDLYANHLVVEHADQLGDIFNRCDLPTVPISQHAHNRNSGIYLHASKQWEYLYALKCIARHYGGRKGLRMADLGGGRGALPPYLALSGHEVTVYDIDFLWDHGGDPTTQDRFRKWGKEHGLNADFGSIFNIPEDDEQFDVVTCISVIEHIKYKHHALRDALRILKKGGVFVMTFDFTKDGENLADEKRVEIFTPSLLRKTLAEISTEIEPYTPEQIDISVHDIQHDKVLGIPNGMTVGGIALVKS